MTDTTETAEKLFKYFYNGLVWFFSIATVKIIKNQRYKARGVRICMYRSTPGCTPYILFIATTDYSKNFTTMQLLIIEHIAIYVVKSIHIQNNSKIIDKSKDISATDNHDH